MTENELLDELIAENTLPPFDPVLEVTAQKLAQALGISQTGAQKILARREQSGELTSKIVRMPNGSKSRAYRKKL